MKYLTQIYVVLCLISLVIISSITTIYCINKQIPFFINIQKNLFSYYKLKHLQQIRKDPVVIENYVRLSHPGTGVTVYDSKKAYGDYTFFVTGEGSVARLIDMHGTTVHKWSFNFSKVWSKPKHVIDPQTDNLIIWRHAHLFSNGDILAMFEAYDVPYGYGLIKLDKNSKLIWALPENIHHSLYVDKDGFIYALSQKRIKNDYELMKNVYSRLLEDYIVKITPDGKKIEEISVTKLFLNSKYKSILSSIEGWDPWHTNSIVVFEKNLSKFFNVFNKGNALISLRSPSLLAVIDFKNLNIAWASRGTWRYQHDCNILDDGSLLLFDNSGHPGEELPRSRIIRFNPVNHKILWEYTGTREKPFFSIGRGSQQKLLNDNILITESHKSRIFEVTKNKEIVWEFLAPYCNKNNNQICPVLMSAKRFLKKDLLFINRKAVR